MREELKIEHLIKLCVLFIMFGYVVSTRIRALRQRGLGYDLQQLSCEIHWEHSVGNLNGEGCSNCVDNSTPLKYHAGANSIEKLQV